MTDWADTLLRVLLDSSLRIALIAFAVAGILSAMRVGSGAVRHAAWTAVLCVMLLMTILTNVVPVISIPVPQQPRPVSLPAPINSSSASATGNNLDQSASDGDSLRPSPLAAELTPRPPIWSYALTTVYGIGVALLLLHFLAGWRAMRLVAKLGNFQITKMHRL